MSETAKVENLPSPLSLKRTLKFKVLEGGFLPSRTDSGSAGYDLKSPIDFTLAPGESKLIDLKIQWDPSALEYKDHRTNIPYVFRADVRSRSGLAVKFNIESFHGLIDSSYRGNFILKISRTLQVRPDDTIGNGNHYVVKRGDRIAQMVVSLAAVPEIEETSSLSETERGEGGFGSSGK